MQGTPTTSSPGPSPAAGLHKVRKDRHLSLTWAVNQWHHRAKGRTAIRGTGVSSKCHSPVGFVCRLPSHAVKKGLHTT